MYFVDILYLLFYPWIYVNPFSNNKNTNYKSSQKKLSTGWHEIAK